MANIFESNAPQEGLRATESAHRKIELQSPADLTYLIANVTRAAQDKIDQHLPPDAAPAGEDALRRRVEQLVDDYIHSTFHAAKPNLTINGLDSAELELELASASADEELEPFDTKLAAKIQFLSAQIEAQTLALATLRRKAPQSTAQNFIDAFERDGKEYQKRLEVEEGERIRGAKGVDLMGVGEGVSRSEEVRGQWERGNEEFGRLVGGLGGTRERLERARRAVEVVEEK